MTARLAASCLIAVTLCACAPAPPRALAGLWSVGDAACAAGRGLTFDSGQVTARVGGEAQPLLENARYTLRRDRDGLTVHIRYGLGPASDGVLVLRQGRDGWLRPIARRTEDRITGSARAPMRGVGFVEALTVRPCGVETTPQRNEVEARHLRGRGA